MLLNQQPHYSCLNWTWWNRCIDDRICLPEKELSLDDIENCSWRLVFGGVWSENVTFLLLFNLCYFYISNIPNSLRCWWFLFLVALTFRPFLDSKPSSDEVLDLLLGNWTNCISPFEVSGELASFDEVLDLLFEFSGELIFFVYLDSHSFDIYLLIKLY